MKRIGWAGLSSAALLWSAGCAPIKTDIKFVDVPIETKHVSRAIEGSRTFAANARIDGAHLVIALTSEETCEVAEVPIIRRRRVVTRTEAQSGFILGEYTIGIGGLVLGGLALNDPDRACSAAGQGGEPTTDREDCVTLGWGLVALGAAVIGLAALDTLRTTDFEQDLGAQEGPHETTRKTCHAGPVAGREVELRIGDAAHRGTTSAAGEVSFSMTDAREEDLPSPAAPALLQLDGESVTVAVKLRQHSDLATHLLDVPTSRVARDRAEVELRSCDQAVAAAVGHAIRPDTDEAAITEAELQWVRAKQQCGAQWTPAHTAKRDVVQDAILTNRSAALAAALTTKDLDQIEAITSAHPELARRLRGEAATHDLLRLLVATHTRDAFEKRNPERENGHRLCRARRIFVGLQGQDSWDQAKHAIAQNVSEMTGGNPTHIARLMDAARCP